MITSDDTSTGTETPVSAFDDFNTDDVIVSLMEMKSQ